MYLKIKKIFLIILLVFTITFISTSSSYALTKQTDKIIINDTGEISIADLSITNITFNNNTTTKTFGLTGIVNNNSSEVISYTVAIQYYDHFGNSIASHYGIGKAYSGNTGFYQMSDTNILSEQYNILDIYSYELSIFINESINEIYTPSQLPGYSHYEYVIDKYDINMVVNSDNTFDITEKVTAYFNIPKHGIYRNIPRKNTIERLDGTTHTNYARITNVTVDNEYSIKNNLDITNIKIGDKNKTFTGEQTYIIKYKYNIGKDPLKNIDELYFNLIGTEWDTVIGNITFKIVMPSSFDASLLGFSHGQQGSISANKITYNIKNNTITGQYNGILQPSEGITVRTELPEGYFTVPPYEPSIYLYLLFIIPIFCLIITIILWYKYGKDNPVIETIEFYPPNNLNSLEIGYLYKGYANNQDVTSLLIYLANKGYLKIVETIEEKPLNKNSFQIIKLKEYDGKNDLERTFFNGIFDYSKTVNGIEVVTNEDLYDQFYRTMNRILKSLNIKRKKDIFKVNKKYNLFITILLYITIFSTLIFPTIDYGTSLEEIGLVFVLVAVYSIFYYLALFGNIGKKTSLFLLIFIIFHSAMFFIALPVAQIITTELYLLLGFATGLISTICIIILLKLMPKRTSYGTKMLGLIKGFKTFLETVEKEQLESMVLKDPTYFYNILPYTYVLGISKKWISKFESINLMAPTWYSSPNGFSSNYFNSFMTRTMSSASRSMSSSPSSGGSSGGGSSGGGSGGGGGGSW